MDLIKEYGVVFPDLQRNEEEVFIMRYIEHVQDVYNIPDILYNFYPIDLQRAWKRLPEHFCEEVELFRKERLAFAKSWNCDTPEVRKFIAQEYWGKMMLGLKLCFNPEKKAGYGEFVRRVRMLMKGLSDTGRVPDSVSGSIVYKLMKKGIMPAVWLLVRKFGKRNLTLAGFLLYALGSAVCWAFPTNKTVMLIGQFIKNTGGLPCSYVFMALFADALVHLAWKTGFRSDGIAMSVCNILSVATMGICTGIINGMLASAGYVAPGIVNGVTVAAAQTEAVKNVITFGFVGLEVITGVILAVLLTFLNVEKDIGRKQAEIKARHAA